LFLASATHQEIAAGAFQVEDAHEHVFCFLRKIESLPADGRATPFVDLDETGKPDLIARVRLETLKAELHSRLPNNVYNCAVQWRQGGITTHHLEPLCEQVYQQLASVILSETADQEDADTLQEEIAAHQAFGTNRARFFLGREGVLETISRYLDGEGSHPLGIWGASGSGKSALMAKAIEQATATHPRG
jgi:hypothetical protein